MAHDEKHAGPYGLMAEFDSAAALLDATRRVTAAGYTKTDAFSPFPIHGMSDALKIRERVLALIPEGGRVGAPKRLLARK